MILEWGHRNLLLLFIGFFCVVLEKTLHLGVRTWSKYLHLQESCMVRRDNFIFLNSLCLSMFSSTDPKGFTWFDWNGKLVSVV